MSWIKHERHKQTVIIRDKHRHRERQTQRHRESGGTPPRGRGHEWHSWSVSRSSGTQCCSDAVQGTPCTAWTDAQTSMCRNWTITTTTSWYSRLVAIDCITPVPLWIMLRILTMGKSGVLGMPKCHSCGGRDSGPYLIQSNPLRWIAAGPDYEYPLREGIHLFYTLPVSK